jgi:hypothetical protein
VCGWKGHSVLEAEDPNTPVQYNMECANCGEMAVQFVTDDEWTDGFDKSVEPDWGEESQDWEPDGEGDLAEPDGNDEGTLSWE